MQSSELDRLDAVVAEIGTKSQLGVALNLLAQSVRNGSDVLVAGKEEQLTPAAAAKALAMSRTHLYKVMDAGELPFVRVGRDRRIAASDLIAFSHGREHDRARLAERFAHAAPNRAALVRTIATNS